MAVNSVFEIVHRLGSGPLRQVARRDSIGSPLGQNQLHDRLAPSGGRGSRALIIRIASATDQ